ncbi:hypothetical protein Taro_010544, partial [Colocasia esculenta]|nr:hypothetical protein [Colocasia esculenta]
MLSRETIGWSVVSTPTRVPFVTGAFPYSCVAYIVPLAQKKSAAGDLRFVSGRHRFLCVPSMASCSPPLPPPPPPPNAAREIFQMLLASSTGRCMASGRLCRLSISLKCFHDSDPPSTKVSGANTKPKECYY